jgi:hypothetical protein
MDLNVLESCSHDSRTVRCQTRGASLLAIRPRLELPPVFVREVTAGERDAIIQLFAREFGETHIVAFGEVMDLEAAPALTKSGSKDS